jgi:hypothetical protein
MVSTGHDDHAAICARLRPEPAMCGNSAAGPIANIAALEAATRPGA